MASMISVISLFVLLLTTYSYSNPVGVQWGTETPIYQFSTNGSTIQNGSSFYVGTLAYEVSTDASNIHQQRLLTDISSEETTTWVDMTISPRSIGESSSEEYTTTDSMSVSARSIGESSSEEYTTTDSMSVSPRSIGESNSEEAWSSAPSEQNFDEFTSTTLESDTAFNQRAIPNSGYVEDFTSSTQSYGQRPSGTNQYVQPSSSATRFRQNSSWISSGQSRPQFPQRNNQQGLSFVGSSPDAALPPVPPMKRDELPRYPAAKRDELPRYPAVKRDEQEGLSFVGSSPDAALPRVPAMKRAAPEDLSFVVPRANHPMPPQKKRTWLPAPEMGAVQGSQVTVSSGSSQNLVTDEDVYTTTGPQDV